MKRIYLVLAALSSVALLTTSCEDITLGKSFIEMPNSDNITLDDVFSTEYYANQVLDEAYKGLPDHTNGGGRQWSILETWSDLAGKQNSANVYMTGAINSSTATGSMIYNFDTSITASAPSEAVRQAWIYIENVDAVQDMTDELKAQRKAEAKVIIALLYFDMLRFQGGMPMSLGSFSATDDIMMERMGVQDMVDQMVALLDEAAPDLPWNIASADSETDNGRMTKAGALALKFKILVFNASPLYNSDSAFMDEAEGFDYLHHTDGYSSARWEAALAAGYEFLDANAANGNWYELYGASAASSLDPTNTTDFQTLRDNFSAGYFTRYNKENIIEGHRYTVHGTYKWTAQCRYGSNCPTTNLQNMFEFLDGTTFDWDNPEHSVNPFWERMTTDDIDDLTYTPTPRRDPRLYETLLLHGDIVRSGARLDVTNSTEILASTMDYDSGITKSSMGMRKYFRDYGDQMRGLPYCCSLLRLPEIYFNMAECLNALGKTSTADKYGYDAYDYLNMMRSRVAMPGISATGANGTKQVAAGDDFLDYLLDERAREFAYEESRYFDLIRHKRSDIFKRDEWGLNVVADLVTKTYSYSDGATLAYDRVWINNWTDRYYLAPIPQDEIDKGYGLVQNPGW